MIGMIGMIVTRIVLSGSGSTVGWLLQLHVIHTFVIGNIIIGCQWWETLDPTLAHWIEMVHWNGNGLKLWIHEAIGCCVWILFAGCFFFSGGSNVFFWFVDLPSSALVLKTIKDCQGHRQVPSLTVCSENARWLVLFVPLCHTKGKTWNCSANVSPYYKMSHRIASEFHGPFVIITNKKANKHEAFGEIIIFRQQHTAHYPHTIIVIDRYSIHQYHLLLWIIVCVVCVPPNSSKPHHPKSQTEEKKANKKNLFP